MSILTGIQVRASRAALGWSVLELASRSKVSTSTIKRIEAVDGVGQSTASNLHALRTTLEAAGIEFIGTPEDGPGIRIHSSI